MKKKILLMMLVTTFSHLLVAQQLKEVFDEETPITWLGLDFTGAILIGDQEKLGSTEDIRYLISSWNNLMESESDKYNIQTMLNKRNVKSRIDIARTHNDELNLTKIQSNNSSEFLHLKPENIQSIIKSYNYNGLSGVGLMFNVESFSKLNVDASVWITFIDMDSKEVIFTERMSAAPAGFGLRNYWAGSIYKIMKQIKSTELKRWKKKYLPK